MAVHLFLPREGEVLLLLRANTGFEDGNYGVIAGHLDGGEDVLTAMVREAREEAGIAIAPADLRPVGVMHRRSAIDERIDLFFVAERWTGAIVNAEPHQCDGLAWFSVDEPPENMMAYIRRALANWRRGVWFAIDGWGT